MFGLPHTYWIIIITCLISVLAWQVRPVLERLVMAPPMVTSHGQFDRFITYGLVHGDFFHLLFNMITLFFFGRLVEGFYREHLNVGPYGFVLFYLLALVVSVLPSFWMHRADLHYVTLGASGAVTAILFAFILFFPWQIIYIFVIPVPAIIYAILFVAYSVYAAQQGNSFINHEAHLTGAAFGLIATLLIEPRVMQVFIDQLLNPPFLNR